MNKEQLLDSYESLTSDMLTPINALILVEKWLSKTNEDDLKHAKEIYSDVLTLAIDKLTQLAYGHCKVIEEVYKR